MSWERKFANIYKEMYASGEGGDWGGGGGNRLLFKLLRKSIKQAHNYFKSIHLLLFIYFNFK